MSKFRFSKTVKALATKTQEKFPEWGTIYAVDHDRAIIRIGQSPTLMRNIKIAGDPSTLAKGDTVSLKWERNPDTTSYEPIVLSRTSSPSVSSGQGAVPDNITIEYGPNGLQIKRGGVTMAHLNFVPSLQGHTHQDSLERAGWTVTTDGAIFKLNTYIHANGQLALGSGSNIIKLDSQDATYRLWAGNTDPTLAPFSVSKVGAIVSTSGLIAGWSIAATQLTSDGGNVKLNSATPAFMMGATGYMTGTGFWVGKATSYKLHIGNPSGDYLSWDGSVLNIEGTVQSGNFASGVSGWQIQTNGDAEFNNVTVRGELRAAVFKYNEIAVTAGTLGVFKSASIASADFTTPASTGLSFTLPAKDSDGGAMLFAVNDILHTRTVIGGTLKSFWATVTARSQQSGYTNYTCTLNSGDVSTTFREGAAIADYGVSGTGYLTLSADGSVGSSPNLTLAKINSYSSSTLLGRLGNINGSYGYVTDTIGIGLGEYASGKANFTWDDTNGIRLRLYTTNKIQISNSGTIYVGQTDQEHIVVDANSIKLYGSDGTTIYTEIDGGVVTLGDDVGGEYVQISSNGVYLYGGGNTNLVLSSGGNASFGEVATNQGNMYWNNSNKRVEFRGGTNGTVIQAYIDTTGKIACGGGKMELASDGITAIMQSVLDNSASYKFSLSGTGLMSGLFAWWDNPTNNLILKIYDQSTNAYMQIISAASSQGELLIRAMAGVNTTDMHMYEYGTNSYIEFTGADYIKQNGDVRITEGLTVGSGTTNMGTGDIYALNTIYINDTANVDMTQGLTINQGANTNEILALKSSTVAHGVTDEAETDTYGHIKLVSTTLGGTFIRGFTESKVALLLAGVYTTGETGTRSTSSTAPVEVRAYKKSGTAVTSPSADENIFAVRSGTSTRFVLDADGDSHQDVGTAWTNFHGHDDIALLETLSAHLTKSNDPLRTSFGKWLEESREPLERMKLVTFNDDGHHFVNWSRMHMLEIGAVIQLAKRVVELEKELDRLRAQ